MKHNSIILVLFLAVFVVLSCKKKEEPKPKQTVKVKKPIKDTKKDPKEDTEENDPNNNSDAFITKWKTTDPNEKIELKYPHPFKAEDYDFTVDWGDKSTGKNELTHSYTKRGEHIVKIEGKFPGFIVGSTTEEEKNFITVVSWGKNKWKTMFDMFERCVNFKTIEATNAPDLSECSNLRYTFNTCINFNGNVSNWDVSKVTDMSFMFTGDAAFNQPLADWDVRNVTKMDFMFYGAKSFKQDISKWDLEKIKFFDFFAGDSNIPCDNLPSKLKNTGCK